MTKVRRSPISFFRSGNIPNFATIIPMVLFEYVDFQILEHFQFLQHCGSDCSLIEIIVIVQE